MNHTVPIIAKDHLGVRFGRSSAVELLDAAAGAVLRYGLVAILLFFGAFKFTAAEANGIQPLIANSPFLSWLYSVGSVRSVSNGIGAVELAIGLLIATRRFAPGLSALGSLGAAGMFAITLSFLFSTPAAWVSVPGFPIPVTGEAGAFEDVARQRSGIGQAARAAAGGRRAAGAGSSGRAAVAGEGQRVESRILPLDAQRDGRPGARAWVRTYAEGGAAISVAAFATHRFEKDTGHYRTLRPEEWRESVVFEFEAPVVTFSPEQRREIQEGGTGNREILTVGRKKWLTNVLRDNRTAQCRRVVHHAVQRGLLCIRDRIASCFQD